MVTKIQKSDNQMKKPFVVKKLSLIYELNDFEN